MRKRSERAARLAPGTNAQTLDLYDVEGVNSIRQRDLLPQNLKTRQHAAMELAQSKYVFETSPYVCGPVKTSKRSSAISDTYSLTSPADPASATTRPIVTGRDYIDDLEYQGLSHLATEDSRRVMTQSEHSHAQSCVRGEYGSVFASGEYDRANASEVTDTVSPHLSENLSGMSSRPISM
jgi:hypothetical protein